MSRTYVEQRLAEIDAEKAKPRLADMTVKAADCYNPEDYVLVHKNHLARLQSQPSRIEAQLIEPGKVIHCRNCRSYYVGGDCPRCAPRTKASQS